MDSMGGYLAGRSCWVRYKDKVGESDEIDQMEADDSIGSFKVRRRCRCSGGFATQNIGRYVEREI